MATHELNVFPLLLAGGIGSRLWPVSRELYPKQLVSFIGKDSLLQSTIKRLSPVFAMENVRVVCGNDHLHEIARHMEEAGVTPQEKIICEPCGRNTAPAILLGVLQVLQKERDAVFCVFPADHIIKNTKSFHEKVKNALLLAHNGHIVMFGIKPNYPETGYGYIECEKKIQTKGLSSQALKIKRFVEKPDAQTAAAYIDAGNFFWNSGMFAFKASVIIEAFKKFQPELYSKMAHMFSSGTLNSNAYEQLPDISIDYAVMEKTDKGMVLPSDFGWSDIGSWKSLYDFLPKNADNNVIDGDVVVNHTTNSLIFGQNRLIAANHLDHMVVVETPDSVFVSDMDNSREVKSIVEQLKKDNRREYHQHITVFYTWGSYTLMEQNSTCKTARRVVYQNATCLKKTDPLTATHFIVAIGSAEIITENETRKLSRGQSLAVLKSADIHLVNKTDCPCHIIEVTVNV